MPGINNYNPIKNKSKKFNNFYNNDLNIMQNNPRQNNFIKRSSRSNYDRFNINNYDSSKPIKLLQSGHKKSASIEKKVLIVIIYIINNLCLNHKIK